MKLMSAFSVLTITSCFLYRMLQVCHRVLYKQLAVWMLHGLLADQYEEFFIHKVQKVAPAESSNAEDEDLGLGGITSGQIQQLIVSISVNLCV